MKTLMASTLAGLFVLSGAATATAPITHAQAVQGPRTTCAKLFTVAQATRAAKAVYRGARKVTHTDLMNLARYRRCQRNPQAQGYVRWVYTRQRRAWRRRLWQAAHPMSTATASVYDAAGGPIACGGSSYGMGVANKSLPCGTRLEICYSTCVEAYVFDRGPYVAGRYLDLSRAVQNAIGFPYGVGPVRYRIL